MTKGQLRRLGKALPRRLRFTREGKLLVFMTLGIGFAAVNSGNNLLYLIFGMQLSLVIVSGLLSELNLRGITAERVRVPQLVAEDAALVPIQLSNRKRRFASYSVEVTELIDPNHAAGFVSQRRGFVLVLRRGQSAAAYLRLTAPRRGLLGSAGLKLTTRYPFGFFEKSRVLPLPTRYAVHPRVDGQSAPPLHPRVSGSEEQRAGVGQGLEFHGLRDHRHGDDARSIAWKISARRNDLVVREYEQPATRRIMLVLSNAVPKGAVSRAAFEGAVAHVASVASDLIDSGYAVGIATCDGGAAPASGPRALTTILEVLARLPVRTVDRGVAAPMFDGYDQRSTERIAITTRSQKAAGIPVPAETEVIVDAEAPGSAPGTGLKRRWRFRRGSP